MPAIDTAHFPALADDLRGRFAYRQTSRRWYVFMLSERRWRACSTRDVELAAFISDEWRPTRWRSEHVVELLRASLTLDDRARNLI